MATVAVVALTACTGSEQACPDTVVSNVGTVASFDFAAGEAPENVTVNPDGSLTVSMLGSPAGERPVLLRIGQNGEREQLAAGQSGDTITGNTRDGDGIRYYNVASAAADRAGVWHLTPAGTARRIAGLPTDGLANGLAIDPSRGTLYAADSRRGTIWTVTSAGGEATAWLTDPALAPGPSASLGANGLRFHNGAVWVSNFSRGTLLRIPIADSGAAERIQVVSSELDGIDDFSFLTGTSDVAIVALNTSHRIAVVYPNDTILTASDGLASPTSTAVRDEQLYITDGGLVAPHDAKLQRATLDVAALLDDSC